MTETGKRPVEAGLSQPKDEKLKIAGKFLEQPGPLVETYSSIQDSTRQANYKEQLL